MEEHLVKNHLGGYYISDDDPKDIETCTEYDDSDEVLVSWEHGNIEAQYEALSQYLCDNPILNKDRLEEVLSEYEIDADDLERTICKIEKRIVAKSDAHRSLVIDLEEDNELTKEMARELKLDISNSEKRQILYVRHFDYSQMDFQNKTEPAQKKLIY